MAANGGLLLGETKAKVKMQSAKGKSESDGTV